MGADTDLIRGRIARTRDEMGAIIDAIAYKADVQARAKDRVTDTLDMERIAIREALGYRPYHFPLRDHYTTGNWMYGDAHDRLVESGDWRETIDFATHRYMREDVEYGLAFLVSVARWAGVDAPIARGLLAIGAAICGTDFETRGPRTLDTLGLSQLSRAQMTGFLEHGL